MSTLTLQDADFEVHPIGTKDELGQLKRDLAQALATIGEMDRRFCSSNLVVELQQLRDENAKLARELASADAALISRSEDFHASLAAVAKQRDEARAEIDGPEAKLRALIGETVRRPYVSGDLAWVVEIVRQRLEQYRSSEKVLLAEVERLKRALAETERAGEDIRRKNAALLNRLAGADARGGP